MLSYTSQWNLNMPILQPVDIEFQKLFYVLSGHRAKKTVIHGISGKFKAGELTAIMGPSGAGKTSLLNILTGFQKTGVQGTVKSCVGDKETVGVEKYRKKSSYILQEDNLPPLLSVQEIMKIAADLKLGVSVSLKKKHFLIDSILDQLGLSLSKRTWCSRLSGGQKKRLSVALELIDNSPIMFLDEPTTGLDSLSSYQCVNMLKALAKEGRTIICTIHQPSATLYEQFDHVYVMAKGKCIYQGAALNTVAYLASAGLHCPQYHNPADYLLEVANGEYGECTDHLVKHVHATKWRSSANCPKYEDLLAKNGKPPLNKEQSFIAGTRKYHPSEWHRLKVLVKRAYVQIYRDWTISFLRFFLHIMVGIFLGVTYRNVGDDGSKVFNNVGFLMISAVYLCYTSLMPAVLKFPSEIGVIRKERFNNWYNLKTYYIAFLIADIPLQVVFSLAYISTSYFLSAQPISLSRFIMVFSVLILVALIASSMGILLGTLVNPINGTFLGAVITAFMILLAGFLIMYNHMSKPMFILSYISYLSYAFEGLVQAIYGFNRAPIPCPDDVEYCHYKAPETLLKDIGMTHANYWNDVLVLFLNFVILRIVAYCTLRKQLSSQ